MIVAALICLFLMSLAASLMFWAAVHVGKDELYE